MPDRDLDLASFPSFVFDLTSSLFEGLFEGFDDLHAKFLVVAARFHIKHESVHHDVCCIPSVNQTDVARSRLLTFFDSSMPAIFNEGIDCSRGDRNRAHAILRMGSCVAGNSQHFNVEVFGARGSDDRQTLRSSIPVETLLRCIQFADVHVSRTDESHFFLNRKENRQRWVWQVVLFDQSDRIQNNARSRPIIST